MKTVIHRRLLTVAAASLTLLLAPTATLAAEPLPKPVDVQAVHVADTTADLWWLRNGASAQDVVERNIGGVWQEYARGLFGSLALTGLAPATTYTFRVYSIPVAGLGYTTSDRSAPVSFTTLPGPDNVPPSAPPAPVFGRVTTTSLDVFWAEATDNVQVTSYQLQRFMSGEWVTIRTVGPGGRFQTIAGMSAATSYTFAVVAFDARGNASTRSAAATVTTAANTPFMTCQSQIITFGTNFQATVTLINTTPAVIDGWTLRFALPTTVNTGSTFNGVLVRSGTAGTITPVTYNRLIGPGGQVTIGFSGSSAAAPTTPPTGFTLDGRPCTVA